MNVFAVLDIQEATVKLVRMNGPKRYIFQAVYITSQISFPVNDGRLAEMELHVITMVMVDTAVPALQAMREQTVRLISMNVCQTLVKIKALVPYVDLQKKKSLSV